MSQGLAAKHARLSSRRFCVHASISPIPRLHRKRQTPADSLLSRGSTASEHEEPLVY
jgi:hypothetical protein